MSAWIYDNKNFTDPEGYWGFIYLITNLETGKKYIGKKFFTQAGYKQVKKKKKKLRKPSDWLEYFGSNDLLLADVKSLGPNSFKREILKLCKSRTECTYFETKAIFDADALLRDDYYNQWLSCKITRQHCNSFRRLEEVDERFREKNEDVGVNIRHSTNALPARTRKVRRKKLSSSN